MLKSLLIVSFLMLTALVSQAQSITGTIVDSGNEPLPFVTVAVCHTKDSSVVKATSTDTLGKYEIMVDPGEYHVKTHYQGFASTTSQNFELKKGERKEISALRLEEDVMQLDAVTVGQSEPKPVFEQSSRGMVVNVSESPIMSSGSTRDMLDKIPGVTVQQGSSLTLKGKSNVAIFIDDKRTYMSMDQLLLYLEGMPASDIEKIEVFDNPPARFDAEGSAGVINIVLKQGKALGLNGMVGTNVGYGTYHKVVPWASFNYRRKKMNVYGNGWYFNNKSFQNNEYLSDLTDDSTVTRLDGGSNAVQSPDGGGGRLGLDFKTGENTTLGVLGFAYDGIYENLDISKIDVSNSSSLDYNLLEATSRVRVPWSGYGANFNLVHHLKNEGRLSADVDVIKRNNSRDQNTENVGYSDQDEVYSSHVKFNGRTEIDILAGRLDYETKIKNKGVLEAGWKSSYVVTDNELTQFSGTDLDSMVYDSSGSNEFNYVENINAIYAMYNGEWKKKLTYDFGLRMEHTYTIGESVTLGETVTRNYVSLFPNLAMKYSVDENSALSLSYSRRLRRPEYWRQNPYLTQHDQFRWSRGNPLLGPEFSHNYTFSYSYKNALFVTGSYSHTNDALTEVVEQDSENLRNIQYVENLDDVYNYSLNLTTPIPIKDWWKIHINATVFYNKQVAALPEFDLNQDKLSSTFNVQNYFTLPKEFKVELGGYWNSGLFWNSFYVDPQYTLNVGLNKQINRFNIGVNFNDFLNLRESTGWVRQGDVDVDYFYKEETRKLMFNLSYNFGNQKIKAARQRQTGSEDVQGRTNSSD